MSVVKKQGENQPDDKLALKRKHLNQRQYTLSVLKEGLSTGSISKGEMECFQLQVMNILKDLIMRYTKGESTSVTVDTAENIMNSIFYSIDTGLKSLDGTEAAFEAIKTGQIKQIYDKGLELVTACFDESRDICQNIRKGRLKVGLEAYDSTIEEALPAFFEKYGAVFDAHNTMSSIDYPLLFNDMSITGVFYIRNYLEILELETGFCSLFPEKEIEKILTIYGQIYRIDYTKMLTNIFELVLNACFFSVLSDGSTHELLISSTQYDILLKKLSGINPLKLDLIIDETMNILISDLNITESKLSEYIERYKAVFKTRLKFALETESLNKLILLEDVMPVTREETVFIEGEKMMDDDFRELVERLTDGLDSGAKISIIRSEIHSLEDFIDLLEAGCLFGDEYALLFSELSDLELGVLIRVIFSDEMRDGPMDLSKTIRLEIETGIEWHEYIVEFLKTLNEERLKSIEGQMNGIIGME